MRMEGQDESSNVEDVRGSGFRPVHGISLGSIVLALIVGWIFHINPLALLGLVNSGPEVNSVPASGASSTPPADDAQARFASQILRSTEVVWSDVFAQMNRTYEEPKLVLFRGAYPTACGMGMTAAGPFYCPNDHRVYLDLSFFDLMTEQLGAPGQFAHAYVIGHEVGHHVQNLLGILGEGGGRPRGRCQRPQRAHRAASRLFCGRLGQSVAAGKRLAARARRCRIRAQCRIQNRRRYAAAPFAGDRRT